MDYHLITSILIDNSLLSNRDVDYQPLEGGVSSDICLLTDGENRFVVKQALPKLRVEDNWYADPSRNRAEREFIRYVRQYLPEAVPDILYQNDEHGFFVMEYLDKSFQNWKEQLLRGDFIEDTAKKAAELLSAIHLHSWQHREAEQAFDTTANFKSLRIEPYLITTGNRHPALKNHFYREAKRLESCKTALVHGDFSPKNIMVGRGRLVVLDHEVAWYGDPAFDAAFLLNHLCLKQLLHAESRESMPDLPRIAWRAYVRKLGNEKMEKLGGAVGRLLLMLMLARIDGKSPVEYLDENQKRVVRSFVYDLLSRKIYDLEEIHSNWKVKLKS